MRIGPASRWFVVTSARGVGAAVCALAVVIPAASITAKAMAIVVLDMDPPSGSPLLVDQQVGIATGCIRTSRGRGYRKTALAGAIGRRRGLGPALLGRFVGPRRL